MGDEKRLIDESAPSVQIWVRRPVSERFVAYIRWGLEEEGIPFEIQNVSHGTAEHLGKEAALNSRLNVGIGLDGPAKAVALHHRDLPDDKPLFCYDQGAFEAASLRRLGANSARLVKGDPLLFESSQHDPKTSEPDTHVEPDWFQEVVDRIVAEFLKQPTLGEGNDKN